MSKFVIKLPRKSHNNKNFFCHLHFSLTIFITHSLSSDVLHGIYILSKRFLWFNTKNKHTADTLKLLLSAVHKFFFMSALSHVVNGSLGRVQEFHNTCDKRMLTGKSSFEYRICFLFIFVHGLKEGALRTKGMH